MSRHWHVLLLLTRKRLFTRNSVSQRHNGLCLFRLPLRAPARKLLFPLRLSVTQRVFVASNLSAS